jgi:hypothetical protein
VPVFGHYLEIMKAAKQIMPKGEAEKEETEFGMFKSEI